MLLNESRFVLTSYFSKSTIPWRPGPLPVMKVVQAAGETGGTVDSNSAPAPCLRMPASLGSIPASDHRDLLEAWALSLVDRAF